MVPTMRVDTVPDQKLSTRAMQLSKLRQQRFAVDLHLYDGYIPTMEKATSRHEFMGEVVEVGSAVKM